MADFFVQLQAWEKEATAIQEDYKKQIEAYQARSEVYKSEAIAYQQELIKWQIAQASAGALNRIEISPGQHDTTPACEQLAGGLDSHPAIGTRDESDTRVSHPPLS